MSEDRRQTDRRVGEPDRRKGDRRNSYNSDKKVLTMTLTTFITVVIVVIVIFVTTLAFLAVYFERKLNDAENKAVDPSTLDYPSEYIDISNIIDDGNSIDNPDENNPEENNPDENNPEESNPENSPEENNPDESNPENNPEE